MTPYKSTRSNTRYGLRTAAAFAIVATMTTACSTGPTAGGLEPEQGGGSLEPAHVPTVQDPGAGGTGKRGAQGAEAGSNRDVPTYGPTSAISAERTRLVTQAVVEFVHTLPTAHLVSTQVLNEAARSSAAAVTIIRGGDRQVLAVSVRKVGEQWRVLHVDSLPAGQNVR